MSAVSTTNTLRKETVEIKADFTRQAGIIQGMWLHQKPYLLYFVFVSQALCFLSTPRGSTGVFCPFLHPHMYLHSPLTK